MAKPEFDETLFAQQCGIEIGEWTSLGDARSALYEIFLDFVERQDELSEIAVSLSRLLQRVPGVHSVRWRIKDPHRLIRKIVRKKSGGVEKYKEIARDSYRDVVTDLIGIRVLHLFKGDFPELHQSIMKTWDLDEQPRAYVRIGDTDDLRKLYRSLDLEVLEHSDGYRSIHYIIKTMFTKFTVKCELQVRTIFEEGWSEIDHKVRYPDFSDNPHIREFLHIFNRLSGAADEMGTFINRLASDLSAMIAEQKAAEAKALTIEMQLSDKITSMSTAAESNAILKAEINELRTLINQQQAELSRNKLTAFPFITSALGQGITDPIIGTESLRAFYTPPISFSDAIDATKIRASDIAKSAITQKKSGKVD